MRTDRIVKRQNMREQLKTLKALHAASKPLLDAERNLRQAYLVGFQAGLKEAITREKANKNAYKGPGSEPQIIIEGAIQL